MIKTKYVVGDVVTLDGKAFVILEVSATQNSLYTRPSVSYWLSDGEFYDEEDLV